MGTLQLETDIVITKSPVWVCAAAGDQEQPPYRGWETDMPRDSAPLPVS